MSGRPVYALAGNERRTLFVVGLTAVTMLVELVVGWWSGSMALWADGFHMASHAGALGVTLIGYRYARRHGESEAFAFGTGKVFSLAGFASAVALSLVALQMVGESVARLFHPVTVAYAQALPVAVIGLVVNLASAWLLYDDEAAHAHGHHDHHHHPHGHHDHNLRAAFLHVVADAVTSVAAILALVGGQVLGWGLLDPLLGIAGGVLVAHWGLGLIRESSAVLLDRTQEPLRIALQARLAADGIAVEDLRAWRLGPGANAVFLEVADPGRVASVEAILEAWPSVEVFAIRGAPMPSKARSHSIPRGEQPARDRRTDLTKRR